MGLFSKWSEQKKIKKSFQEYLSPGTIDQMKGKLDFSLNSKEVNYVLVRFKDDNPVNLGNCIQSVSQIGIKHEAMLEGIMASLMLITIGTIKDITDADKKRESLANELIQKHGAELCLIHGKSKALVGNIGGETRFSFGSLIPNFSKLVGQLSNLNFGESRVGAV